MPFSHYNSGQKQLFGTQFEVVDGRLNPRPIEDVANLHRRRKDWGLPPLHEHYQARHRALGLAGSDDYTDLV